MMNNGEKALPEERWDRLKQQLQLDERASSPKLPKLEEVDPFCIPLQSEYQIQCNVFQ